MPARAWPGSSNRPRGPRPSGPGGPGGPTERTAIVGSVSRARPALVAYFTGSPAPRRGRRRVTPLYGSTGAARSSVRPAPRRLHGPLARIVEHLPFQVARIG